MRVTQKLNAFCECWNCNAAVTMVTCVLSLLILCLGTDAVHRHSNSVYPLCCVVMFKKVENPSACEMRSVICFFNAKIMKLAEIHCQVCDVYGEHAMSSSVVQRWVRLFNEDAKVCMTICGAANCCE